MNQGPIAHTLRSDDLVIIAPIACVLRAFTRALTVFTALARPGKEKSPASHTS
jgi:hypothetical protein